MHTNTPISGIVSMLMLGIGSAATALADDLTMMVEQDLARLGYDTGPVDGEATIETVVAISKFQSENELEVTGEVTPQLVRTLSARPAVEQGGSAAQVTAPASDPAALRAAQQACLERAMERQRNKNEKKRAFRNLLGATGRVAARHGNFDMYQKTAEVYDAGATAQDVGIVAKELGISKKAVARCENPK